jgi:hypothetical protein
MPQSKLDGKLSVSLARNENAELRLHYGVRMFGAFED